MSNKPLQHQLEKVLDNSSGPNVDVIIQMESDREIGKRRSNSWRQVVFQKPSPAA